MVLVSARDGLVVGADSLGLVLVTLQPRSSKVSGQIGQGVDLSDARLGARVNDKR